MELQAEGGGIPPGWWDDWRVQEAARRCDPWSDLVGFFEQLSVVIEEYAPKVEGWLTDHGFTSGECLDLMSKVQNAPADNWEGGVKQLYLHGLDAETIALMLSVDVEMVQSYLTHRHHGKEANPSSVGKIRELHAKGLRNIDISRELGVHPSTVQDALSDLGLVHNGHQRSSPQQRAQCVELAKHGTPYSDIVRLTGLNLNQVKNTLRRKRRASEDAA